MSWRAQRLGARCEPEPRAHRQLHPLLVAAGPPVEGQPMLLPGAAACAARLPREHQSGEEQGVAHSPIVAHAGGIPDCWRARVRVRSEMRLQVPTASRRGLFPLYSYSVLVRESNHLYNVLRTV